MTARGAPRDRPSGARRTDPAPTTARAAAAALLPPKPPVDLECAKLLAVLRKRCPGLFKGDPLPPGTVGPEVPVDLGSVRQLAAVAAVDNGQGMVVWASGDNELVVLAAKVDVQLSSGLFVVRIPVECEQIPAAVMIEVAFATGDDNRPAGMVLATESRPRGPAAVVDVWADALVAYALQVVVRVTNGVAGATGVDTDGAPLVSAGLVATPDGIRVQTLARHAFDRVGS